MNAAYRSPCPFPTKSIEDPILPNDWCNLLDHEDEQDTRTKAKKNVVDLEEGVEALRLLVLQKGLNAKDSREVHDERGGDRRPGRERCDTRFPAHVRLWQVGEDGREDGQQRVGDGGHFRRRGKRTRSTSLGYSILEYSIQTMGVGDGERGTRSPYLGVVGRTWMARKNTA
jgi:hypothetical protein